MNLDDAQKLLDEAIKAGMNTSLEYAQPDPVSSATDEPIVRLRIAAPPHLPAEQRRLPAHLVEEAVKMGVLPATSDLLLE